MRKQLTAIALASILLLSTVGVAAAAASTINFGAAAAQNPKISTDVTVSPYDRGKMNPGEYEADSGEVKSLPAEINQSSDNDDLGSGTVNPYHFTVTDVNFTDARNFPTDKPDVTAIDASEWSKDASGQGASGSVSDSTTAPGVDAVKFSTSSLTSTDTMKFTMSNFSVTSDAEKRYLQIAADVNTLDAGAGVQIRVNDADADYVVAHVNSSKNAANPNVLADATGEGYVLQEQIGNMTVSGGGDGTMSEIQSVEIQINNANAAMRVSALNVEKTGEWNLGTEKVDTDSEDDLEEESIIDVESPGDIQIRSLDSMSSEFDNAVIHGLTMPMEFGAEQLEGDDQVVNASFSEASNYPSFEFQHEVYYRLELPSAYDLSYANADLTQTASVPNDRYQTVEISEGADGTDFGDIDSWTDVKSSLGSQGESAVLDNTIQVGQEIVVHEVALVTDQEKNELQAVGAAGQFGQDSGGIFDLILSPLGALAGLAGGALARIRGAI